MKSASYHRGRAHATSGTVVSVVAFAELSDALLELARPRGLRPLIAHSLMGLASSCEADGDRISAIRYREEARLLLGELGLSAA